MQNDLGIWRNGGNNKEAIYQISVETKGSEPSIVTKIDHSIGGNNYFNGYNLIEDLSVKTLTADWNNIKSNTDYSLADLSTALSNKICIDDKINNDVPNKTTDLSIIKLSKEEFDETVALKTTRLSANVLYIVESNYMDAYG